MKSVLMILLLLCSSGALAQAQPDSPLAQLDKAYGLVQQEQQSAYQQFLMAQELRRNELQDSSACSTPNCSVSAMDSGRTVDYDENIKRQKEKQQRIERYDLEIRQSYARYLELGLQRKLLLDRIIELTRLPKR